MPKRSQLELKGLPVKNVSDQTEYSKEKETSNRFNGISKPTALYKIPVVDIPVDKVLIRKVNEFDMSMQTDTLESSIESFGLIHPIVVVDNGDGTYTVTSGNRRLTAYQNLNARYPDGKFALIPACVYRVGDSSEVTDDNNVITRDTEQSLYMDANLETRQISFSDALKHIDYLQEKITSNDALIQNAIDRYTKLREQRNPNSKKATYKKEDFSGNMRDQLISDILTNDLKFSGWSASTLKRYRIICEAAYDHPNNEVRTYARQLINKLKSNDEKYTIKTAYNDLLEKEGKGTTKKTSKVKKEKNVLKTFNNTYDMLLKNWSVLEQSEKEYILNKIRELENINS